MSLSIDLTEGQIRDAMAVALAEAMTGAQRDALVRDVVRAHLTTTVNTYGKETLLSKAIGDHIRRITITVLEERLTELEPEMRQQVRTLLGAQWEDSVLASFKRALTNNFKVGDFTVTAVLD